jgi:lipid-A-disaccharide synthase-like uncharacterized protein
MGVRRRVFDRSESWAWLITGLLGNAAFALRFGIQWIASERAGESVVPRAFWSLSLAGALLLGLYALHVGDVVFLIAAGANLVVYVRNLALLRARPSESPEGVEGVPSS